jgi:hypothetical protein
MNLKFLFAGIAVIALLALAGCVQQGFNAQDGFSLEYSSNSSMMKSSSRITIDSGSILRFESRDSDTNAVLEQFSRKLADKEVEELAKIIAENNFFALPSDLTPKDYGCFDAATESLQITLNGRTAVVSGYCIGNQQFRSIVQKIYALAGKA